MIAASHRIAAAIGARDVDALRRELDPGFVQRSAGGPTRAEAAFLEGVSSIPGEILFVRLEGLAVDLAPHGALASGIQHARVRIDGREIDDRRGFVDWFVERDGAWKLRAAIDLPGT